MIVLVKEKLSPPLEGKLRRWLSLSEVTLLRKVITAKCQFLQAEALAKAIASVGDDQNSLVSREEMKEATRYSQFLAILDELINQSEPFQLAKLKPATTDSINTNENFDPE